MRRFSLMFSSHKNESSEYYGLTQALGDGNSIEELCCAIYTWYYTDNQEVLFERWFYCNLGPEIKNVIEEFLDSEERRIGKPGKKTFLSDPYFQQDVDTKLEEPLYFKDWLDQHREDIQQYGSKNIFSPKYNSKVEVYGPGSHILGRKDGETVLWQQASDQLDLTEWWNKRGMLQQEGHASLESDSEILNLDPEAITLIPQNA
ncbi:HAAO, partial [Cordylochernes scorpioides]